MKCEKNKQKNSKIKRKKIKMMNSPSNLMNYPDAYGQYYLATPTPAAMAPDIHYRHNFSNKPPK